VCVLTASVPYERLEQALKKAEELQLLGQSAAMVVDTREVPELASGMLAVIATVSPDETTAAQASAVMTQAQPNLKPLLRPCTLTQVKPIRSPTDLLPLGPSTTPLVFDWANLAALEPGCHGYSVSLDAALCVTGRRRGAEAQLRVEVLRFPSAETGQPGEPPAAALPSLPEPIVISSTSAKPTPTEQQSIDSLLTVHRFVTLPLARPFGTAGTAWVDPKTTIRLVPVPSGVGRMGYRVTTTCSQGAAVELGRGRYPGVSEPALTARIIPTTDRVIIEARQPLFEGEDVDLEPNESVRVFAQRLGTACTASSAAPGVKLLAFEWSEDNFEAIELKPGCSGYSPSLDAALCTTGTLTEWDTGDLKVAFLRPTRPPNAAALPDLPASIAFGPEALKPDAAGRGKIDAALRQGRFELLPAPQPLTEAGVRVGDITLRLASKVDADTGSVRYAVTAACNEGPPVELLQGSFESNQAPRATFRAIPGSHRIVVEARVRLAGEGLDGTSVVAHVASVEGLCAAPTQSPDPALAPDPTPK
jgi:hypothetical protein